MSSPITLTGLWLNKDKNGDTYMSGYLGYNARIMIFKNKRKRNSKDPDYNLVIVPKDQRSSQTDDEPPPPDEAPPF